MSQVTPLDQSITLNNGTKMPIFGLGTWLSAPGEVSRAVEFALEQGYRHIDCAAIYRNEQEIGETFDRLFNTEKKFNRSDVYVVSKLWNTFHKKEHVRKACLQTLSDLKLDYLDMYLIHWPFNFKYVGDDIKKDENVFPKDENGKIAMEAVPLRETWEEMEKLVDDGLVKSIGISNFPIALVYDLLTYARIKPAANQVECHPYLNQRKLKQALGDIALVAYSPLGHFNESSPVNNQTVKSLAEKLGKTPAQILLKWSTQRGCIVIPKSTKEERIIENSKIFDFELSSEDMESLEGLEKNNLTRTCDPINFWSLPLFD
ncbi:predicted protein [Naegleria gruberi]|uniref:Predicted protein n=1 Tax=Naegleria gruberi TaxID=5762 RepID=D2W426_NAEGR|nr:uncharacterized protein NAEGRDRAFT_44884 [Naegleria gruberi]EFC36188.1 predicted protein [Naegleria gruberi]|eukprot:XP_002668932.1 predicted protein [Naegleria gruberi strain NEG-M]